jgi:hypothetical protein
MQCERLRMRTSNKQKIITCYLHEEEKNIDMYLEKMKAEKELEASGFVGPFQTCCESKELPL